MGKLVIVGIILAVALAAWRAILIAARLCWACRAAIFSIAPGVLLIAFTDQARDMVIASGLPSIDPRTPLALLVLAFVSWYWARVTLTYSFVNPTVGTIDPATQEKSWDRRWWETCTQHLPRIIGASGMAAVTWTLFKAAEIYDIAGDAHGADWAYVGTIAYAVLTVLFYAFLWKRTWVMTQIIRWFFSGPRGQRFAPHLLPDLTPVHGILKLNTPLGWFFLGLTFVLAPLSSLLILLRPVGVSTALGGAVPVVLLGLALMVPLTSTLVVFSAKLKLPFYGIAVTLLVLAPVIWSDNHDMRTCPDCKVDVGKRPTLAAAFEAWWTANTDRSVTTPIKDEVFAPPMIMVATAGGASRAAYWTAKVLGEIAQREDHFTNRLFMISSVSGGSLGATAFRSMVESARLQRAPAEGSLKIEHAPLMLENFIRHDFLGPTLANGLFIDFPARAFAPVSHYFRLPDRADALETAWESAWEQAAISKGRFTWANGFNQVFMGDIQPKSQRPPWPILALNGTSVESGKRIVTSNVQFWTDGDDKSSNMSGGANRYDMFDMTQVDIPISTAVTTSARFPVVSPTGAVKSKDGTLRTRIVDGGLFENFGAFTLDEVLRYLVFRRTEAQMGNRSQVVPIAILISSDPSLDQLGLRQDGTVTAAPPDCAAVGRNAYPDAGGDRSHPHPLRHDGNGIAQCPVDVNRSEEILIDPIRALYDGRVSRGEAAATALEDRIMDARVTVPGRLIKTFAKSAKKPDDDEGLFNEIQARIGVDDHIDFFHFRQCRVNGSRGPTMSWHDSQNAWDVMDKMLGLANMPGVENDPCGNQVEFFRLCVRLERLSGKSANDRDATTACQAKGWPKPEQWTCTDAHDEHGQHPEYKRSFCRMVAKP